MLRQSTCSLLLLLSLTEASVDFSHSRIYDEYDFAAYSSVTIDGLCTDSCRIYASITPMSHAFAANLLIQTPKGFTSVADVAGRIDQTTGQKLYLEVSNTDSLVIVNANTKQEEFEPVVLYVVNQAANFFSNAEVYEAIGFHRSSSIPVEALTVMSAAPFVVKQAPIDGPQAVYAQMVGFDSLGAQSESCPYLYSVQYDPFPGFDLEVNGPIISLHYDISQYPSPSSDITARIGIEYRRQLERAGWVGSAGFHGCQGKQPYRSSLFDYRVPMYTEISNDQPVSISVEVETNSGISNPVVITDEESGDEKSVTDTLDAPFTFELKTSNLTIRWTPDGTGLTHFLVRWNSTIVPHS